MFNLFKNKKANDVSSEKIAIPKKIDVTLFGNKNNIYVSIEDNVSDKKAVKDMIDKLPSLMPDIEGKIRDFIDENYFEFLDFNYEGTIDFGRKEGQFYHDYLEIKKDYDEQTKNALDCVLRSLVPNGIHFLTVDKIDMVIFGNKTTSDGLEVIITSDEITVSYSE